MQARQEDVKVIMDKEQIAEYNRCICENAECEVVNIADFSCTEADGNRGENVSLKGYGIIINEADVRAVPMREAYILAEDDMRDDQYQKSTLKVGEGVWILGDFGEEWKYVRARNCTGWVESRYITKCTRKEFLSWLEAENFAVVTRPADIRCGGEEIHFAMGSRLLLGVPIERSEESLLSGLFGNQCSGRLSSGIQEKQCGENLPLAMVEQKEKKNDKFSIVRPTSLNGRLAYESLDDNAVSQLEYNEGYLLYTTESVLSQAMKLLDLPYGWGNAAHGLDCSGFIVTVYECFGIHLPRNTSAMRKIPFGQIDLSRLSCEEKIARLRQVKPGSLLLFQGHVMMWLGIQNETPFIIHEVSGYRDDKGEINNVRKCVITPLDILRKNGESMLEAVDIAVLPEIWYI